MNEKKLKYFLALIKKITGLDSYKAKERKNGSDITYFIITISNKDVPLGQTTLTLVGENDDLGDMLFGECQGIYSYLGMSVFKKQIELEYYEKWPRKNLI